MNTRGQGKDLWAGLAIEPPPEHKPAWTSDEELRERVRRLKQPTTPVIEAWRYTRVSQRAAVGMTPASSLDERPPHRDTVQVSGGAILRPLTELLNSPQGLLEEDARDWIVSTLASTPTPSSHPCALSDLHALYCQEGEVLIVPKASSGAEAIIRREITCGVKQRAITAPSLWVYQEAGSSLSLEESFEASSTKGGEAGTSGEKGGVTLALTHILLKEGAQLSHVRAQLETRYAKEDQALGVRRLHLARVASELRDRSSYTLSTLNLGANTARVELDISLNGAQARAELGGVYVGADDVTLDQHLTLRHLKPNSFSSQRFRGVLGGQSRGVFTGRVVVSEGSHSTLAEQNNPNLLVSRGAKAVTRPQLEIYNDDVECSHGATVGQLDEDALFYLRSRGLSEAAALRALTMAFVSEIRQQLHNDKLSNSLDHALARALEISMTDQDVSEAWVDWEQFV